MPIFYPMQYRTVPFDVDLDWLFRAYLPDLLRVLDSRDPGYARGLCSSVTDTLDMLWQPFRTEAASDMSTLHSMIGCYNLHRSDHEGVTYLFWTGGWGAPHKVLLYAQQLVATYWQDANLTGATPDGLAHLCAGFPVFLRGVSQGGLGTRSELNDNRRVERSCRITINVRNAQAYPRVNQPRCPMDPWPGPSDEYGPDEACSIGFKPRDNEGLPWRDGEPFFNMESYCYSSVSASESTDCLGPQNTIAYGGYFNVTIMPHMLYWRGRVCDKLLFWARFCLDYGIYRGSQGDAVAFQDYRRAAERLSRYAMRHIVDLSQLMVHEFGHTYISDDLHCGHAHCCFDLAAKAFFCRVKSRLGLPEAQFNAASGGNDYPSGGASADNIVRCGADGSDVHTVRSACWRRSFDPGAEGNFEGRNVTCPI